MTHALRLSGATAVLAFALGISAASASDSLYQDQVSADSFGNLVIHSAAGYKRIVVGAGELAAKLHDFGSGRDATPGRNELDEGRGAGGGPLGYAEPGYPDCLRGAAVVHGRSYMYGVPANVAPVIEGACE